MKKVLALILVTLMLFPLSLVAGAESTGTSYLTAFENRPVMDDLAGGQFGGEEFSILRYPYIAGSEFMQIMTLLEFGYNEFSSSDSRYGDFSLFLYIYNPGNKSVSERDLRHSVTMKVGESKNYKKYSLKLLSTAGDGTHDSLYLKFKVNVSSDELRTFLNGATERVYNLSEMEIVTSGDMNATAYEGGVWTFSGFSDGYGETGDGLLTVTNDKMTHTVVIDELGQDVWRKEKLDDSDWEYIQIDSVYFTIPHEITDRYGEHLVDILYEYYAYDTGWMVGFEHDKPYNLFKSYEGEVLEKPTDELPILIATDNGLTYDDWIAFWVYNNRNNYVKVPIDNANMLSYVFKYGEGAAPGTIVDSDVREYFSLEWRKYRNGESSIFNRLTGPDGENSYNLIHSQDLNYQLSTFHGKWWQTLWDSAYDIFEVPPIQVVDDNNVNDVKNKLYLNGTDMAGFKSMYESAKSRGDKMYVFHFAVDDYYSHQVFSSSFPTDPPKLWITGDDEGGFVARETIYMDFDMLQMTFEKDGVPTTLPVQMSPKNVIGELPLPPDYKSPDDGLPTWVIVLIIVAIVLVVMIVLSIFVPFLGPIFKVLVQILLLPLKLLLWLIKAVGKGIGALFKKIGQAISNRKQK